VGRFRGLVWSAVAVWAAWLGLIGLLAAMLRGHVAHPHFLPVTALFGAMVVAWVVLAGGATWRLIRGPARRRALACLLLGSAPTLALTGHILYVLRGYGRSFAVNDAAILLAPFGESILDLAARVRYPRRTAGAKVVMISGPTDPGAARAQVAAMDRHIRALETRLGRTMPGRVHWVRGPLMGVDGRALYGLCLGTRPGDQAADAGGLAPLDRHEVAHCVIGLMGPTHHVPPALLVEGWAEANGGLGEAELEARAVGFRETGNSLSLRELTGPDWYGRHEWPVYYQGAPLVNHLIKTYGPDRFFAFYTDCRPDRVADSCRRTLGVDLDRLDAQFQAALDRRVDPRGVLSARLAGLRVGPGVDPAAWSAFLDEYLTASARLLAPYDHVRVTTEFHYEGRADHGRPIDTRNRDTYWRSGPLARFEHERDGNVEAYLATPERSVRAERKFPAPTWEVKDDPRNTPDRAYRQTLHAIESREPARLAAASLLDAVELMGDLGGTSRFEVTALEHVVEDRHPCVRVRIEDRGGPRPESFHAFTSILAADDGLAARRTEYLGGYVVNGQTDYLYDRHDGVPVLKSSRTRSLGRDGRSFSSDMIVTDRQFGPPPASDFTARQLLPGPTVLKPSAPYADTAWQVTLSNWYGAPLAGGVLCLVGGAVACTWPRPRRFDPIPETPKTP